MVRTRNFDHITTFDMESQLFAGLSKFKWYAGRFMRDDDFADRLNHTFTSFLLVMFTLIISARQYIGKPIACWVPTEFSRAQEEYAESVCWVTSTYFVEPGAHSIPKDVDERNKRKLLYYQWVPFILMGQAFLFNIPCIVWRLFNWQSGINLVSVMQVACDVEIIKDRECRKVNVSYVAHHIDQCLNTRHVNRNTLGGRLRNFIAEKCCLWCSKMYGSYLICLYIICKMLYIMNVISQFFIMNRVLGTNYTFYGFDLVKQLADGRMWQESGHFPRITICDFEIRKLANKHIYSVQCVLPINMFNEKIFIFLWFWFVLVSAVTISSFISLTYEIGFVYNRINFACKFLKLRHKPDSISKSKCRNFVEKHLRHDGVFLLRLLAQNAGDLIASEITDALWKLYIENKSDTKSDQTRSKENHRSLASSQQTDPNKPQLMESLFSLRKDSVPRSKVRAIDKTRHKTPLNEFAAVNPTTEEDPGEFV